MELTEKEIILQAKNYNWVRADLLEAAIEKRPSMEVGTALMSNFGTADFVFPSDGFIMLASWYAGIATQESTAAVLSFLRRERPESPIIDRRTASEIRDVDSRLRKLSKQGVYLKKKYYKIGEERGFTGYIISPLAIKIIINMLELPIDTGGVTFERFPARNEEVRMLLVSRWISNNLHIPTIKHIARNKSYLRMNGTKEKYVHRYLWFSSEKNNVEYSTLVFPFVLTRDRDIVNEKEYMIYNVYQPFDRINAFFRSTENTEKEGRAILIVDREEDLPDMAKYVRERLQPMYYDRILITTAGIIATQPLERMYFDILAKFIPEDRIPY